MGKEDIKTQYFACFACENSVVLGGGEGGWVAGRSCADGLKSVGAEKSILRAIKLVLGFEFWVAVGRGGRQGPYHTDACGRC